MGSLSQAERPLQIHIPTLGADQLFLLEFEGKESLSSLFRFQLHLVTEKGADIAFDKVLGQAAAIEIKLRSGVTRYWHGIVAEFSEGEHDDAFVHFHAELVPGMWLLQHQLRSQIFQTKSVPEILASVLAPLRPDVHLRLSDPYPTREYCVQYQETDLAFACRLMEEEGIYFYFQHERDKHELILTDSRIASRFVPEHHKIDFLTGTPTGAKLHVRDWRKTQRVVCAQHAVRDRTFLAADRNFDVSHKLIEKAKVGKIEHSLKAPSADGYESCIYPGGFAKQFDAVGSNGEDKSAEFGAVFQEPKRLARLYSQLEAARALEVSGASNCAQFLPGFKFALELHPSGPGEYLLTHVAHRAWGQSFRSGAKEEGLSYENSFQGIPAEIQYRPARRTPRPTIHGVQTATVVTTGSTSLLDKFGRAKVKFHWDRRAAADPTCSCWLRVGQVWAGKKWGGMFFPRKGHEVIVAFENGDPDCPLIVGSVYNSVNHPPLQLPDYHGVGGIKSCIVGDESAQKYNGIFFHDDPDEEYTHVHSETNDVQNAQGSRFSKVGQSDVYFSGGFPSL